MAHISIKWWMWSESNQPVAQSQRVLQTRPEPYGSTHPEIWSRLRELNPHVKFTKLAGYHYIKPAFFLFSSYYLSMAIHLKGVAIDMSMKEKIIELRNEGKSYSQIHELVGASISTIRYHVSPHQRKCSQLRKSKSRKNMMKRLRELYGNKCKICGYNKSQSALSFHHTDPNVKENNISDMVRMGSFLKMKEEAKKCILICSNCHHELHDELIK